MGLKKPAACESILVFNVQHYTSCTSHISVASEQKNAGTDLLARKSKQGNVTVKNSRKTSGIICTLSNGFVTQYSVITHIYPRPENVVQVLKKTKTLLKFPQPNGQRPCHSISALYKFTSIQFPAISNVTCPGECVCSHIVLVKNTEGVSHISL